MSKGKSSGQMKKTTISQSTSSYTLENMVGCSDMVLLDPLTEDNLVKNLQQRFAAGEIYSYIGHVLISVNPYKPLSIYTPEYVLEYRSRNIFELPPHIYAVSDDAYRSMRDRHQDQCVIISGESGAGKTEASKQVMQYLAMVSGKGEEVEKVKEQLLQSNPVLEAFGNAKTNKNDNSSRFGKYMDIEFDFKGDPVGGIITNYLMEKSRVIWQAKDERNFHIFYQMLSGLPEEFLDMLHLERDTQHYHYLTGCYTIQSMKDSDQFDKTMKAMEVIGFDADEISAMLEMLAAILNLGNIKFESYSLKNGTDACKLSDDREAVNFACDMLGCSVELLEQCLTKRSVETKRDVILTPLSLAEAVYARDGLSKAIYDRLFSWLVTRINDTIKPKHSGKRKCMGVLDIYGFEIFETNSFEQFMINYCNEKLQQLFVDLTLCTEQQEYIREGIEWEPVEYFDNSVICELIEDSTEGILALLDEECLRPGEATDLTFLERLNKAWLSHEHYISRESREHRSDHTLSREQFRLIHYAGQVNYDVAGFLDKNTDKLFKDLSQAMFACERMLLKKLFPEGNPTAANLKRPLTTGYQFKTSMSGMIKNLLSKNPNYIRCIKPNKTQKPKLFDKSLVATQTRYLGLLENIRVRRAGFAFRQSYEQALQRYKMLCSKTWPTWKRSPRDGVKAILQSCVKNEKEYSFGRSKLFIRTPMVVFQMEEKRKKRMHDLATLISKVYRGWIMWKKYQTMRKAQITISRTYRGHVCRKNFLRLRNATVVLQKYTRGWKVREQVRKLRYFAACTWASYIIRRYFQSWKLHKELQNRIYRRRATPAAIVIQAYFRGWKTRKRVKGMQEDQAAPVIYRFIKQSLRFRYLVTLAKNLPSLSPLDKRWPRCSPLFRRTTIILRKLYHQWRCKRLRSQYESNPRERRRMVEKVKASGLFRGKKTSYSRTVAVPFKQDRLGLRTDERWLKIATDRQDQRIVWADNVQKLNKSDAKFSPRVLVITAASLMVLDVKHYALQYRSTLADIEGISVSPYGDHFCVIHLRPSQSHDKTTPKGDFIFQNANLVELVTKTLMVVQEVLKKNIKIVINDQVQARLKHGGDPTAIRFEVSSGGLLSSSPLCKKKGNTLAISVPQ